MKFFLFCFLILCSSLSAIPNAILGGIANASSPLDGVELADPLIAALGGGELPGEWKDEASVPGTRSAYLMARPKVLGEEALLVRGLWRAGELEEIQITFNDAGSYFGYLEERIPVHLNRQERAEFLLKRTLEKQQTFVTLHEESLESVKKSLGARTEKGKSKTLRFGKSRAIRAEVEEYQWDGISARLFHGVNRLVRVSLAKEGVSSESWMDREVASLNDREYGRWLQERATKLDSGDVVLQDLAIVPQGYRPYCGLNTLVMAGRYLGLHLDEDWLASAGKFQNTGSAAGSQMLSLYGSVASEAGVKMKRLNDFDGTLVKRSLREGLPVIVWRRWSQDRNRIHSRVSRSFSNGEQVDWALFAEAKFPDEKAPLHASVIVGFNEERNEFLFLESWEGQESPRRMPTAEMQATSYLTFCFQH